MTRVEPLLAVQAAVIQRLRAHAALTALVPAARILDAVPERETFPYVVFDAPVSIPDRTMGQDGREVSFVLTVFTRDGSERAGESGQAGYRQAQQIADAVAEALTGAYPPAPGWVPLAVEGYDVTDVDIISAQASRANDGISRQLDLTMVVNLERQAVTP